MTPARALVALTLLAALVSLAVFAVLYRGRRDPDAERKGSRFLLGLGDLLLNWFLWAIGPVERALLSAGATPDHMNAAGLWCGLAAGVLIALGHLEAGGWSMLAAGACDVLDGRLARVLRVASVYGKFIDSTLDRWVETFAFLGFAVYFGGRPWGALVVAAGLGGSLLVSYAQARGESVGVSGSGGLMQRAERLALSILGCLFDPVLSHAAHRPEGTVLFWVLTVVAAGALGTALHRTVWIARRLRRLS